MNRYGGKREFLRGCNGGCSKCRLKNFVRVKSFIGNVRIDFSDID